MIDRKGYRLLARDSIAEFDVSITPSALVITAENERGVLMTLRLERRIEPPGRACRDLVKMPAEQYIFEREDLPEAYIVAFVVTPHLRGMTMTGVKSGEGLVIRDELSAFEMDWVLNGRVALRRLSPPMRRYRLQ